VAGGGPYKKAQPLRVILPHFESPISNYSRGFKIYLSIVGPLKATLPTIAGT